MMRVPVHRSRERPGKRVKRSESPSLAGISIKDDNDSSIRSRLRSRDVNSGSNWAEEQRKIKEERNKPNRQGNRQQIKDSGELFL